MTKEAILQALKGCKTQDERAEAILELLDSNGLDDDGLAVFPTGIPGAAVEWEEITPDHLLGRNCNGSIVEIQIRA